MLELEEKIKTFTNVHGEVMTMKRDQSGKITIFHEDCNNTYEPALKFLTKYILIKEEMEAIMEFMKECTEELRKI